MTTTGDEPSPGQIDGQVLLGKVAVITGTSSGIGRAAAVLFARHGAQIVCIDNVESAETIDCVRSEGAQPLFLKADVADEDQVIEATTRCDAVHPQVDILFSNAGAIAKCRFEDTSADIWQRMLAINLSSSFYCATHFLPLLKKSRAASVILHASIDAIFGNPHIAAYSAAKGGLLPLAHVMAHDLGKYGIRVNCISSGGIRTGMRSEFASRIEVTPMGRIGEPDEVAHAALFLASDWSSYVSGANLVVDGGRTAITQGVYHR